MIDAAKGCGSVSKMNMEVTVALAETRPAAARPRRSVRFIIMGNE